MNEKLILLLRRAQRYANHVKEYFEDVKDSPSRTIVIEHIEELKRTIRDLEHRAISELGDGVNTPLAPDSEEERNQSVSSERQERFSSEAALLKAIDAQEAKRVDALERAEQLELEAKAIARGRSTPATKETYEHRLALMATAERSVKRAENRKKVLGNLLSQFRTMLLKMPMNDDNSVVL